jgi:hypothetical protein
MTNERKPVMCGLGPMVDKDWKPIVRTRKGALATARKTMPADLKRNGFDACVWEGPDYFRVNYGKPGPNWRR